MQINSRFAQVANELAGATALQFTDANISAEDFFVELLNRVWGYEFKNTNILQTNSPGIDMADDTSKIAGQVTSDTRLPKIRKTLKVFGEKKLHNSYNRLLMVYPVMERTKRRETKIKECPAGFDFDFDRDVICFNEILGRCRELPIDELEDLAGWMSREVVIGPSHPRSGSDLAVDRIIALITYLGENEPNPPQQEPEAMPDPDRKLVVFAEYRTYLESQYVDHASAYMPVDNAKSSMGYDGPRAQRTTAYLRQRSRFHLDSHNNNAQLAFEALFTELRDAVSFSGTDYESSAIRYFLAHEMIACNVFPLPRAPALESDAEATLKG